MGKDFSTSDTGGFDQFTGFMLVGKPFEIKNGFHQPENTTFGEGRCEGLITGKIHKPLGYSLLSYDGTEEYVAPQECVGHTVSFFVQHPKKNHVIMDEGPDGYWYRASRRGTFRRWWPNFTLEMLLSKVGASTKGLSGQDDEVLMKEIVALLNTSEPFPWAVWESSMGDIERQIPVGTEVLAQFYRFLYYDWSQQRQRPTWVTYELTNKKGEVYTYRDCTFLLRVVAPDPWTGTILRLKVNYTVKHIEEDGIDKWWHHEKANFSDVMKTFGVYAEDFGPTVDEALLYEAEPGEPANWLGPLEAALQQEAKIGRLVHIKTTNKPLAYRNVDRADDIVKEEILGASSFKPPVLRSIADLSEAEIEAATEEPEEEIPGFETLIEEFSPTKVMKEAKELAGFPVWEGHPKSPPTEKGLRFAKTYLVPMFAIVGLERGAPLAGWTDEKLSRMKTLMADEMFKRACKQSKEAAIEYGENLLAGKQESNGSAF